ncbi:MAG: hypothetical protein NC907_01535, partial [Candidatus Omnitrophica bacterium]|nr:hypothetical protein [Candidatus Omnitrophota bacterium]
MIGMISGSIFFTVCIGSVFTLFLLKLGAREKLIGFLSILPSIVGIFSLWITKYISRNPVKSLILAAWSLFIIEICFLPVFFLAGYLSPSTTIGIFCALLFLFYFPWQSYVYAWFPVIESVIPYDERGSFLGILRISLTLVGYAFLQISSRIFGPEPEYIKFFCVLLIIVVFSFFFPYFLSRARIPETRKQTTEKIGLFEVFRTILHNTDHNIYFKFVFMMTFITGISSPFLIPFYRTELGMS